MSAGAKAMSFRQHVLFWMAIFAFIIFAMWLFGDVLLPFVAGMAIAYLCNPLTNRLERMRIPRWIAALIVITLVVLFFVLLMLIIVPVIGAQLAAFIQDLPGYIAKLQALVSDPSRPWLSRFVGERFAGADKSAGELMTQAAALGTAFLGKVWSGGAAVISLFSLLVITPVVAFYFISDWPRIIGSVERLVPRAQHDTVVRLARETDTAIAGFVRGQTVVCVVLGVFYAVALSAVGLNFGLLIGLLSGLISFIPYVGSATGFVLATGIAARTILAGMVLDCRRHRHLPVRSVHRRQYPGAETGRRQCRPASALVDVRALRLRLPVRLSRPAARRSARGGSRRARAVRCGTLSR